MELFGIIGWITVPQYVLQFIDLQAETLVDYCRIEMLYMWITLGVGLGLYLIGLVFGGFGLYTLAKRAGYPYPWLGFFPFANTYLTGKLAGETSVFNAKVKRIGLWTMLCEIAFVALNVFQVVVNMLVLDPGFYTEEIVAENIIRPVLSAEALSAAGLGWIVPIMQYDILGIINYIFSLVVLFLFCMLFFAFYRKYYARSPFMMTFLSAVLPGRGFAIFAVRKNKPVDYNAFLRNRMQQQQQQYGNYGPQNGGYGPQSGNYGPQSGPSAPPEDPFGSEFGGTPPADGNATGGGGQTGSAPPDNNDPFPDF